MQLVTQAGVVAIFAWLTGTALARDKDRSWDQWRTPWGAASQPFGERPLPRGDPTGRHLAVDCRSNPPGATDSYGGGCFSYRGAEQYCGCCDTVNFTASLCGACSPSRAESCAVSIEQLLARLPRGTEEIRHPEEFLFSSLPEDISERFPNLTVIDLKGNQLEGEIPPSFWRLPRLRELHLDKNRLVGSLPDVPGRRITSLGLEGNKLSGSIPESMGTWTELRYLNLWGNELSGRIPESAGGWQQLVTLYSGRNMLTGSIPEAVGSWSKVRVVALDSNELTGPLPLSMANWTEVHQLWMDSNKLNGSLPDEVLGGWRELTQLHMTPLDLDGMENELYRGRAAGMVAVQCIAVAVPVLFLVYQLVCAVDRVRDLLPGFLRPPSVKENQMWLKDFLEETERAPFASVLERFDTVDMHHFRTLVEQSSATLGHGLAKRSRSYLVRMHSQIRSTVSEKPELDSLDDLDPMEEQAAAQAVPVPRQGATLRITM